MKEHITLSGLEAYRLMTLAASGYEKHSQQAIESIKVALDPNISCVGPGVVRQVAEEEIQVLTKLHEWLLKNGYCSPYTTPPTMEELTS